MAEKKQKQKSKSDNLRQKARDRLVSLYSDFMEDFRHDILLNESDRGAVLVATSFVEEAMEHLLRAVFTAKSPNKNSEEFVPQIEQLLEPGTRSSIGDFASRISVSFVIGIIDSDMKQSLDELRELRNSYSHRKKKGGKPELTSEILHKISSPIIGPGIIDIGYLGLLPKEISFDSLVGRVGKVRIHFAATIWIILLSINKATGRWIENSHHTTLVIPIGRYYGPTFEGMPIV